MKPTFKTVAEIKAFSLSRENPFFSKGAVRAFKSKTHSGVYGGEYFVTSEDFGNGEVFQVRRITETGRVATTLQKFATLADARAQAKELAKQYAA